MIGGPGTGFATAMRTLDHTRVTIAAQAVGIAQGALDYAPGTSAASPVRQAGRRFQGIQFMLADMGMKLGGPPVTYGGGRVGAWRCRI